jgi:hypothetical protein
VIGTKNWRNTLIFREKVDFSLVRAFDQVTEKIASPQVPHFCNRHFITPAGTELNALKTKIDFKLLSKKLTEIFT